MGRSLRIETHKTKRLTRSPKQEGLDELEAAVGELMAQVDERGGAVEAITSGFVQREIHKSALTWQREVESGERAVVGVNSYQEEEEPPSISRPDPAQREQVLSDLAAVRAERDSAAVEGALDGPDPSARLVAEVCESAALHAGGGTASQGGYTGAGVGAGSGDTLYEDEDDDRYGFILVGRHLLARLDLADGNYLPAAKALRQLSVEYESAVIADPGAGLQTFNGQLAHFESAVALWQAQQSAKALTLFAALVPPPVDGQPTFDPDNAATYIGLLAAAMDDNASRGQLVVAAEELPVVFRGLAYWVLAQHQKGERLQAAYLDKANETIGNLLIWPRVIGKEGDHVQHPEER